MACALELLPGIRGKKVLGLPHQFLGIVPALEEGSPAKRSFTLRPRGYFWYHRMAVVGRDL